MPDPFAQLAKLIENLETLGEKGAEAVGQKLEPALNQVLQSEYEQGKGPDGQGWAHKADGSPSHLQKSGDMRRESKVVAGVKGVSVRIPKPGGFHQAGTSRMPARPLVPSGDSLPPDWQKAAEDATRAVILDGLGK
jgi:hypothetical protein